VGWEISRVVGVGVEVVSWADGGFRPGGWNGEKCSRARKCFWRVESVVGVGDGVGCYVRREGDFGW